VRSSLVSRARYTSPIPPAPRGDNTSYGPRRAPEPRVMRLPVQQAGGPVGHEEDRRGPLPVNRRGGEGPPSAGRILGSPSDDTRPGDRRLAENRPRHTDLEGLPTGRERHGVTPFTRCVHELVVTQPREVAQHVESERDSCGGDLPFAAGTGVRHDV